MQIENFKNVVEVKHEIEVDTIALGNGRFIFRQKELKTRSGDKDKSSERQGICNLRQLADLKAGRDCKPEWAYVFTAEERDVITRFGMSGFSTLPHYTGKGNTKIFDHVANGGSLDDIVQFSMSDHSFTRLDGSLMPTALSFNYIDAHITDLVYDIRKLVEVLRQRDDVFIVAPKETGRRVYRSDRHLPVAAEVGEEIDRIPYYNSECGTETVTFFWTPSQEQAEEIATNRSDRFKTVFDNDWLGLRAGGAAKFDSFYKTEERELED